MQRAVGAAPAGRRGNMSRHLMGKGRVYRDRQVRYTDSFSKREVTRLTGYLGHSWQLYFTHPCWVDGATALVLKSERENRSITGSAPPCGSCASTACRNARSAKCRRRCAPPTAPRSTSPPTAATCAPCSWNWGRRGGALRRAVRAAPAVAVGAHRRGRRRQRGAARGPALHHSRQHLAHALRPAHVLPRGALGAGRSGDSTWTPGRCGRSGPSAGSIR